ncbi:hypothetical protein EGR_02773 [Echinococcus granulosus]|uniref:Uncharacterized protein n=1 Tax=Echinococcus granulosus TaxID=6210 RepID=W6ULD0_ECHGR|nr:hypothetical protein EGR_02773 [Echinococcus granulosus]EUB62320.1 hypothetical protein EGR_02773 [Echinococcus granulosus]
MAAACHHVDCSYHIPPIINISLKDRYESLKLLCSEQVMANELLKEELDRLRKSFQEISRHRAFLLEKLIALQSKSTQNIEQDGKKTGKSPAVQNSQNRNNQIQRSRAAPTNRRPPIQRPKAYPPDGMSVDESDPESESMPGDFNNGWEDDFRHMGVPSYRRPQSKNVKRQLKLPPAHAPSFKRSRMIEEVPGPSSRGNFIDYSPSGPSHSSLGGARASMSYEFADICTDLSEEPPIIYSKGAGFPSNEAPRRTTPSILKTSSIVGGNVNDRPFTQKPPPLQKRNSEPIVALCLHSICTRDELRSLKGKVVYN